MSLKHNIIIKILSLMLFFVCFQICTPIALAGDTAAWTSMEGLTVAVRGSGMNQNDLFITIGRAIGLVISMGSTILIIIVVYGGLLWMTASGNEQQVEKARKMIIQGVIGLLVTLLSYTIGIFILNFAGGNTDAWKAVNSITL